jgi:hypothetical protein
LKLYGKEGEIKGIKRSILYAIGLLFEFFQEFLEKQAFLKFGL